MLFRHTKRVIASLIFPKREVITALLTTHGFLIPILWISHLHTSILGIGLREKSSVFQLAELRRITMAPNMNSSCCVDTLELPLTSAGSPAKRCSIATSSPTRLGKRRCQRGSIPAFTLHYSTK